MGPRHPAERSHRLDLRYRNPLAVVVCGAAPFADQDLRYVVAMVVMCRRRGRGDSTDVLGGFEVVTVGEPRRRIAVAIEKYWYPIHVSGADGRIIFSGQRSACVRARNRRWLCARLLADVTTPRNVHRWPREHGRNLFSRQRAFHEVFIPRRQLLAKRNQHRPSTPVPVPVPRENHLVSELFQPRLAIVPRPTRCFPLRPPGHPACLSSLLT